jgi:hypothetical protein
MATLHRSLLRPLIAMIVCLAGSALAQSGGGSYRIDPATIAGGGGTVAGGAYSLSGTFGQTMAATLAGPSYVLHDGFWSQGSGSAPGDAIFANGFDP